MTILMYHSISDPEADEVDRPNLAVHPDRFRGQMRHIIERGFEPVGLGGYLDKLETGSSGKRRAVAVTFDDGFADNYRFAFPILQEFSIPATIFLIANRVAGRGSDDDDQGYLSLDQVSEMAKNGISFGSHTMTHRVLSLLSEDELRREIAGSRQVLEEALGRPVEFLAYPRGSFTREIMKIARAAGYRGAVTAIRDNRNAAGDPFRLRRVMVMRDTSLRRFNYYFSPLYHWTHVWKNRRRWRI